MSRIEARELSVSLGKRRVIDSIDLSIPTGSLIGLIGPNGAGKTTLMRALAGLLPFSGEVLVDGRPLAALGARERARQIAYMAQRRDIAWPITVEDVVALGRLPHRPPFTGLGAEDRKTIDRMLAEFDLGGLRTRLATELSGGELARLLSARALAQDAGIVIADEPTSGLDPVHQLNLMQTYKRLADEGHTIILSLHELGLAARWCERLLLLSAGRLAADGRPDEVLTPETLRAVYRIEASIQRDEGGLLVVPTGTVA